MTRPLFALLMVSLVTTWLPLAADAGPREWFGFGKKTGTTAQESYQTPSSAEHQTVYVTRTGHKFHRAGCKGLKHGAIPMEYGQAVRSYKPCSKCWGRQASYRREDSLQNLPSRGERLN